MTPWLIALLTLTLVTLTQAGTLTLAWNGSPGATSYRLYYGESSGHYPTVLDTGPATRASVGGLTDNTCYYFVATALDDADDESEFSNEVSAEPRRNNRPRACRR